MVEIDYSLIQQEPAVKPTHWTPPRHVFFGGRNRETGEMIQEPVYVHQEYPRMVYAKKGDKLIADVVKSDAELEAKGKEWVKNPAELGFMTCPSFEQAKKAK